jgi:hypothetical protein
MDKQREPEHKPDVADLVWPLPRQGTAPNQWQTVFLQQLSACPNVSKAARAAGVARRYAYWYKQHSPDFAAAWDDCIEAALDNVEEYAIDRGQVNDNMAMFLLASHRYKKTGNVERDPLRVAFEDEPPVTTEAATDAQFDEDE